MSSMGDKASGSLYDSAGLDSLKLKGFADGDFKFDKIVGKFSKRVEKLLLKSVVHLDCNPGCNAGDLLQWR